MMTGCPGVFAGGDMVPAERTVTVGVGHGKKAARFIDAYLRERAAPSRPSTTRPSFELLHPWYFADARAAASSRSERRQRGSPTSPRWSAG